MEPNGSWNMDLNDFEVDLKGELWYALNGLDAC